MRGRSACSTARTARPISSRTTTSTTFFATDWKVHYNSDRTGVRLIGPKPEWARERRRRGRPAPVQHPRQRLRRRHDRLHRRHADHPRPRRPGLGGFVCPATDRAGRALEDGPAQARRQRPLRRLTPAEAAVAPRAGKTPRSPRSRPSPAPPMSAREVRRRRLHRRIQRATGRARRASPTAAPATTTCSSSTARWCSISRCASASTR